MNTEELTTPSPELKQHAQELKDHAVEGAKNLHRDVRNVAQDVKEHANRGVAAVREEASARFDEARSKTNDLFETAKNYAADHPLHAVGFGILVGMFLARRRR